MDATEPFKLKLSDGGGLYARSLRAIGQDLTDLFPETIEIERRGDDFVVRGTCARSRLEAEKPKPERKSLKEILTQDITTWGAQNKSDTASFARTYDAEDIARIDEAGSRRRTGAGKIPDIRALGEILRTIGRLIEGENGRMIRIVKDRRQVAFEYLDADGKACKQELSSLDLRKMQQRFYEKRGETKSGGTFKLKE